MRGGEAESGPTHNDNRPSRSGKMCGFYRPCRMCGFYQTSLHMQGEIPKQLAQTCLREGG